MAYGDFTLERACREFDLSLSDARDLFAGVSGQPVPPFLQTLLDEYVPLALSVHTGKARSELIVAPILVEVRKLLEHRISLFSGTEFDVAPERGLDGVCDFILAASPVQYFVSSPVMMIVEAKNDNIKSGLGQCVAAMFAARLFNERDQRGPSAIHGAVTTGSLWRFLTLDGATVAIDAPEYTLDRVDKILAILRHCVGDGPASKGAAA